MTQPRWIGILEALNIVLAIGLLMRWNSTSDSVVAVFAEGDRIEDLHAPGAVHQRIQTTFELGGGAFTVEDIVRHLHAHPELLQSNVAKQQFRTLQEAQTALIDNMKALESVELELNHLALELYTSLSEAEQTKIRSRRNTDSVEGIEAQYWLELMKEIEK